MKRIFGERMELKLEKLTDRQLAERMANYIERLESLRVRAEYFSLGACPPAELAAAVRDYQAVQAALRAEAAYCSYHKNGRGSALLWKYYAPSVSEAAAWGLSADPAAGFDRKVLQSIEDALHRLTARYSFDYWQILADR